MFKKTTLTAYRVTARLLRLGHDCHKAAAKRPDRSYVCSRCGEIYDKPAPWTPPMGQAFSSQDPGRTMSHLISAMVFPRLPG